MPDRLRNGVVGHATHNDPHERSVVVVGRLRRWLGTRAWPHASSPHACWPHPSWPHPSWPHAHMLGSEWPTHHVEQRTEAALLGLVESVVEWFRRVGELFHFRAARREKLATGSHHGEHIALLPSLLGFLAQFLARLVHGTKRGLERRPELFLRGCQLETRFQRGDARVHERRGVRGGESRMMLGTAPR